jgi:hypothetical protein
MDKKLFEGIKFGDKEKQVVLQNSEDYNIGIEYEFNLKETEPKSIHDLVDLEQDLDDVIRDMVRVGEEYGLYLDSEYASYMVNYLRESFNIEDYVPSVFMDLIFIIRYLSEPLTDSEPEDTETEDMFRQEKKEAYFKLYRGLFLRYNEEGEINLDNIYELFNSPEIGPHAFYAVCKVLDVFYVGDLFKGKTTLMEDFYKFYILNTNLNPEFFDIRHSEENIRKLEDIDSINDIVESILDHVRKSSLITTFTKDDDVSYTVSESGFDERDFNIDEYVDYLENYGNIPDVTDFLIGTFDRYVNDLDILEDNLDENELRSQVAFIDHIEDEHNGMKEVITEKMTVRDAIENIQDMFRFMSNNTYVEDYAGMHISISTTKYDLDDFKLAKFITIMDIDHIRDYFPDRTYVDNLQKKVEDLISKNILGVVLRNVDRKEKSMVSVIKDMEFGIDRGVSKHKYQTINFGDYKVSDGRIELRFFGGENYHQRYEEVVTHLLRALYLLNFAYTNEHNKDYYKKITKMINAVVKEHYGVSFSYLYSSLMKISEKIDILEFLNEFALGDHDPKVFDLFKRYFKNNTVDILNNLTLQLDDIFN